MTFLRHAFLRLRAILGRDRIESEMQDELRHHVERATERYQARGMTRGEAELAARREFGNRTVIEEEGRDARGARWLAALAGDVRFALRYFARHKATVAIVIAVLTLGTGANTLFFSVYRDQFTKPAKGIPDDPAHAKFYAQTRLTQTGQWTSTGFTVAELTMLADRRDIFSELAGWVYSGVILDAQAPDSAGARSVAAHFVTPNYFRTIGVHLAHGQSFVADGEAADLSAVMNYRIAQRLYGNAAAAVGRRVLVNETPVRVVGVASDRFEGASKTDDVILWMPLSARPDILRLDKSKLEEGRSFLLLGRLAPGATHDQATAFAQHVVTTTLPDSAARVGMARTAHVQAMTAAPPGNAGQDMIAAALALAMVGGIILLIGWMNVSSLMVAAAVARRHEIAVRLSLGASRRRLLRQLVTESTLLSLAGGAAGLAAGSAVIKIIAMADSGFDPVSVMPDAWTYLFVGGLSVVTGIIFGLSPALHATRAGVASALRDSGAATSTRARLQRFFVGTQIVLSQPMLVVLGVILSLMVADFKPHAAEMSTRVIGVGLQPLVTTGAPSQRIQEVDALIPRLRARPELAAAVQDVKSHEARRIVREGAGIPSQTDTAPTTVALQAAAPGWFDIVEVPIVAGRDVQLADTIGAERNVVLGSDLAQRLWPGANPLGRRLASPPSAIGGTKTDSATLTVVGVYDATKALPEMHWAGPGGGDEAMPRVYTAHGKAWRRDRILVRTHGPAEPYLPELNRVLRAEIPSIPVTEARTLEQVDAADFREAMRVSMMAGAGGLVALLLASLGLYGVVSLSVQQRIREIGIRIAVGARPGTVTRMFLASGVRVSLIALLVGIPLSIVGVRIGVSMGMVFGPSVNVYLISATTAALLVAVAVAATWLPARRASRVDPATTLRSQ